MADDAQSSPPNQTIAVNDSLVISLKLLESEGGRFVPLDRDIGYNVTKNSNPEALEAAIGRDHVGGPALIVRPKSSTPIKDIEVEVSDDAGHAPVKQKFDLIDAAAGPALALDLLNARHVPHLQSAQGAVSAVPEGAVGRPFPDPSVAGPTPVVPSTQPAMEASAAEQAQRAQATGAAEPQSVAQPGSEPGGPAQEAQPPAESDTDTAASSRSRRRASSDN